MSNIRKIIINFYNSIRKVSAYIRLKPFEVKTPEGRSNERNRRVILCSLATILVKIISLCALIITTPLILNYLGNEGFGLWMTLSSLIIVLGFIDLGIGNGLLNIIADAHGSDGKQRAQRAVTSSFVLLTIIAALLVFTFAVTYDSLDWASIYNVSQSMADYEAGPSTAVLIACLVLSLPLLTAQKVQLGYQDGMQANLWLAAGNIFMLIGILLAMYLKASLPFLVLAMAGGPTMALALNWMHQFFVARPWLLPQVNYFDWKISRHIIGMGAIWTWFQVMAFIGTSADNLIISHIFGAASVGSYAVMSKLQSALLIAQLISAPLWPAFAEAIERGDLDWARRTFRRAIVLFTCLGLFSALVMGVGSFWIVQVWVGTEMIPTSLMALGFAFWGFITNFFSSIAALMANNRLIKKFTILTTVAAILSFALKFVLAKEMGVEGVIWASVIGYGLVCIPGFFIARMILK